MKLGFMHNWGGKLDTAKFTSIRANSYWENQRGNIDIYLKGNFKRSVKLVNVIRVPFNTIDKAVIEADTGLPYDKALEVFKKFKVYPDTLVCILFMEAIMITAAYLQENPKHIFVYGDNTLRIGNGGAAALRDYPNTYGFITKKYPRMDNAAFYTHLDYPPILEQEMEKLIALIRSKADYTFLISPVGAGLANRFKIFSLIKPCLESLRKYPSVKLL